MRPPRRVQGLAAVAVALACAVALPAAAGGAVTVVARGLDNPRGLDIGPGGRLYVTEAGRGGSAPCVPGPEGAPVCFGTSGAVTRIDPVRRRAVRVVRGLPSLAQMDGTRAIGPSDVSFAGHRRGYLTVGLGANPSLRGQLPPAAARAASLFRMGPRGGLRRVADLGAFEAASNPDAGMPGAMVDTNPNSVDASNPRRIVVADAGGNDVLAVTPAGRVSVLAVLPFGSAPAPDMPGSPVPPGTPIPVQPVPTSVVRGPDGAYYVGELTGFPFPNGAARVWRIAPRGKPRVFARGLTQIIDVAFGPDRRSLYVLEIARSSMLGPPSRGALIRISLRRRPTARELAPGQLDNPTGLVLDRRFAYVSNHGAAAGRGEVVRIPLPRR